MSTLATITRGAFSPAQAKQNKARAFVEAVNHGLQSFVQAGEIIVDLIDNDGLERETIVDLASKISGAPISLDVVRTFEKVGRKNFRPELAIASYPAAAALRRLPYGEQGKLLSSGVEFLTAKGDIIILNVANITDLQKRQIFLPDGGVRGIAAQRAWVESEKTRLALADGVKPISSSPWTIRKGRVTFNEGVEMSRKDLMVLLTQMED